MQSVCYGSNCESNKPASSSVDSFHLVLTFWTLSALTFACAWKLMAGSTPAIETTLLVTILFNHKVSRFFDSGTKRYWAISRESCKSSACIYPLPTSPGKRGRSEGHAAPVYPPLPTVQWRASTPAPFRRGKVKPLAFPCPPPPPGKRGRRKVHSSLHIPCKRMWSKRHGSLPACRGGLGRGKNGTTPIYPPDCHLAPTLEKGSHR